MGAVYCPLSMTCGNPMRCVATYDGNTCNNCLPDSAARIASELRGIADVLNYPAELFGTQHIADAIGELADAVQGGDQ